MTVVPDRYSHVMTRLCHAGACLLVASSAHAQLTAQDLPQIQQGGLDVNPLAYQHIVMPYDLEVPNDFETLHQVYDPSGATQYVRFAGATAAVFPRSVYLPTSEGILPDIPPDTIFYIDGLPPSYSSPDTLGPGWSSPSMVQYQVDHRALRGVPAVAAPVRVEGGRSLTAQRPVSSMWVSETHRRARVSQLLREAARAGRN